MPWNCPKTPSKPGQQTQEPPTQSWKCWREMGILQTRSSLRYPGNPWPCSRHHQDTEVLRQADLPSSITVMRKAQLRWASHVSRKQEDRIPKQLFYGELWFHEPTVDGHYKDSLKVFLKDFNISTESWEFLASDRPCWRQLITKGATHTQQRSEGPVKPRKSEQYARKEPPALTAQPLLTSVLPVREASLPGLVWSATSGHLWQFIIKLEVFGHLWLRRTSNNNSLRNVHDGRHC